MRKIFIRRLAAYALDFLLISLVTASLAQSRITNPNYDKYNNTYKEYTNISVVYTNFTSDVSKALIDNKLTDDEYFDIVKRNSSGDYAFKRVLERYYADNELTRDEYDLLVKDYKDKEAILNEYYKDKLTLSDFNALISSLNVDDSLNNELCDKLIPFLEDDTSLKYDDLYEKVFMEFTKKTNEYNFKLSKLNRIAQLYIIFVYILYFGVFVYFVNGISLGKKIFKLQIVRKNGERIGFMVNMLRTVILTNILFMFMEVIGATFLNQGMYTILSYGTTFMSGLMEILIIGFTSFRKDGRGLHDLICGTKVISTKEEENV